jgi:molecular chaperone DnaJ
MQGHKDVQDTHYDVLAVLPSASLHDIKQAYRKQASKWHPDKWGCAKQDLRNEAKERFCKIQQAYEVLVNDERRCLYDAKIA